MSRQHGSDATFRIPNRSPVEAECGSLGCEAWATVTEPAVVVGLAVVGLVAFLAFAYVREAKAGCREERRRVVDEHDAFVEFSDRVAALEPTQADARAFAFDGPVVGVRTGGGLSGPPDVGVQGAIDAYRDTVLTLPHYTEEYDETAAESLAAELGNDAARRLVAGGSLSPELQSALVTRSRHAAERRETLTEAIDKELDALDAAEETLTEVDRSRERLLAHLEGVRDDARIGAEIDVYERLELLERRCDEAVADRQELVRDPPMQVDFLADEDAPTFHGYLYGPLEETTHPVLAEFASLVDRIREDRDRLASRIAGAT